MEQEIIQNRIHEVRGVRVMLDKDLAELYQVTTGNLNKAVKRNIKRFPSDFMFQLTKEEWETLKFQIETPRTDRKKEQSENNPQNLIFQNGTSNWGGTRKLPFAFTEQGLAMLSGILNSDIAIYVNIAIMRAFVTIRQGLPAVNSHQELEDLKNRIKALEEISEETLSALNDLSEDNRKEFDDIYLALSQLAKKKDIQQSPIGYKAIQERRGKKQ